MPAVAISARLLIKRLFSQVGHLFLLTSKPKKARFTKGFMDEKENTMLQGITPEPSGEWRLDANKKLF